MKTLSMKRLLGFLLLAILISSCSKPRKSDDNNILLQSYRLIDDNRADEAIVLLEDELKRDPKRSDYTVGLASAYAHKAGIKVQKLVAPINFLEKFSKLNEQRKNNEEQEKNQLKEEKKKKDAVADEMFDAQRTAKENQTSLKGQGKVSHEARNITIALSQLASLLEAYNSLPSFTREQSNYLLHAINLLNDLGHDVKPEDAIYRGILRVLWMKFVLSEKVFATPDHYVYKTDARCFFDMDRISSTFNEIGKLVIDTYGDLAIATPKQADDYKIKSQQAADAITKMTVALSAIGIVDESYQLILKETIIQNGLGNILTCR